MRWSACTGMSMAHLRMACFLFPRKAHRQKKRYEAPGSLEFMHLLNALAESNEDAQAPAVKRAAAALEIPLSNRVCSDCACFLYRFPFVVRNTFLLS